MYQIVALHYVQFDIPKSVGSYYRFTIIPNARGKNKREFAFNPKPCTKQERRQSASFLCFIYFYSGLCQLYHSKLSDNKNGRAVLW